MAWSQVSAPTTSISGPKAARNSRITDAGAAIRTLGCELMTPYAAGLPNLAVSALLAGFRPPGRLEATKRSHPPTATPRPLNYWRRPLFPGCRQPRMEVNMFGSLTGGDGGVFDEFRRLQEEIDSLFDQWPATMGVRSVVRGTFPPINVAATADQFEVYLFAPGLDAKKFELSIQQNLLTVTGERQVPVNDEAT